MSSALEAYLRDLREIRFSGAAVRETSFYPPLRELFNRIGKSLAPTVRCIIHPKNKGAGLPDGGLFTPDQLPRGAEATPLLGLIPARGVIEAKGTKDDVWKVAESEQVRGYLDTYGQVLVTNLRDFLLVERGKDGQPTLGESFRLADSEAEFWAASADPHAVVEQHGEQFEQYLRRVLLHRAPLFAPKDVAFFLASYARDAKARIEHQDLPALDAVRTALEEALGLRFEGEKGDHFFRSSFVQTLFYGVFSAWVLWSKQHQPSDKAEFDWRTAVWSLRVPAIRALFEQVALPTKLEPLGLDLVLDWAGAALNRVDHASFFARFREDHAVRHFYEPFLEEFDPELRKDLGVWYTPSEVVEYMVARVDTVLRDELGIADGLADPRVHVLDPCTGTGSYLVEVLKRIAETLRAKADDALVGEDVKRAALERIHGFEILPAPFVVAHLQLGLLLQNLGAPLSDVRRERASIYLTNALTGWAAPKGPKTPLMFPELEAERDAAEHVKRDRPILVVLANPPYNAFAGVSPQEEAGLVDPYKVGLNKPLAEGGWGIRKFNLDDLYIRFFRLAERRIVDQSGRGVICYVSNFSYLSDPSYIVMRQRFLSEFDALWFDSLNGDSRETGKRTPEGAPDPSIFSTDYNREGIRVGTAIGLMVRKAKRSGTALVRYREFWGVNKRAELVASLGTGPVDAQYELVHPDRRNRFSFRLSRVAAHYTDWPKLIELADEGPISGLQEMRRGGLMAFDKELLRERMAHYYDPTVEWEELKAQSSGLTENAGRFDAQLARRKILQVERFDPGRISRYALYPMDLRWAYYSSVRPLWNEPRPALVAQRWPGNTYLVTRPLAERPREHAVMMVTSALPDYHLLRPNAVAIPFRLRRSHTPDGGNTAQATLQWGSGAEDAAPRANLSPAARNYLTDLGVADPDADVTAATLLWFHALAVGYSPAYLTENADGVRQDWPRVPLPATREVLAASAALGRQVAALLDVEQQAPGVTEGTIRPELRSIAQVARTENGELDLAISVGWGHAGQGGVVMPGRGRLQKRKYTEEEREVLVAWANPLGLSMVDGFVPLGDTTYDVYLNAHTYWKNVPTRVWDYTIGGYQVIKKWLSYREQDILGRPLTIDETREVRDMARRIAALLLLEPQLDANYRAVTAATHDWARAQRQSAEMHQLW